MRRVDARARDVAAGRDRVGALEPLGVATLLATVDPATFTLTTIEADPEDERMADLTGVGVGPGYRRRLASIVDDEADQGSLLVLLLDDLAGAQLVAGYETVSADPGTRATDPGRAAMLLGRADMCAGWIDGGTLIEGIRATSSVPLQVGPSAPPLESPEEPDGWHVMAPLPPGSMRRRRRLDLEPATDGRHRFEAHFRDTHCSERDGETILHEYRVRGTVDAVDGTLLEIGAEALVLPYPECPSALAGVGRMAGAPVAELRRSVNRELTGTSACTHLNDVLRSLADLDALLDHLDGAALRT